MRLKLALALLLLSRSRRLREQRRRAPRPATRRAAPPKSMSHSASATCSRGKLELAFEKLEKALKFDSSYVDAHTVIAVLYERINDQRKAAEHYKRAAELAPRNGAVNNNYGTFLCRTGKLRRGRPALRGGRCRSVLQDPRRRLQRTPAPVFCRATSPSVPSRTSASPWNSIRTTARRLFHLATASCSSKSDFLRARAFLQRFEVAGRRRPRRAAARTSDIENKLRQRTRGQRICAPTARRISGFAPAADSGIEHSVMKHRQKRSHSGTDVAAVPAIYIPFHSPVQRSSYPLELASASADDDQPTRRQSTPHRPRIAPTLRRHGFPSTNPAAVRRPMTPDANCLPCRRRRSPETSLGPAPARRARARAAGGSTRSVPACVCRSASWRPSRSDDFERIEHDVYLRGYLCELLAAARHAGAGRRDPGSRTQRWHRPTLVATGRISHSRYLFQRYSVPTVYVILTGLIVAPAIWLATHGGLDQNLARVSSLEQSAAAGNAATADVA